MALSDMRREYLRGTLDRADLAADPIVQFQNWFTAASGVGGGRWRRFGIHLYKAFSVLFSGKSSEANAMTLATADAQGNPSARMVLLKGVDQRGLTFFTNYSSRKGCELDANPVASLVFYWSELERQVCISGPVTRVSPEESAQYFSSRPRGSRLAAWASPQSTPVADRAELEAILHRLEVQYAGQDIPLPSFWGGYRLQPQRMEFWQGRASRLHDRFRYTLAPDGHWELTRLAP